MTTASEDGLRFAGYAALFDKRDAGRDTIRPGAFARTLADATTPARLPACSGSTIRTSRSAGSKMPPRTSGACA
jgi:hypothetical protein